MFLDLVAISLIVIFALLGLNKGLVSSSLGIVSRLIVFICSLFLSPWLARNLYNIFFKESIIEYFSNNSESMWAKITNGLVSPDNNNLNDAISQSSNSMAITAENSIAPTIINILVLLMFILLSFLLSFVVKYAINLLDKGFKFTFGKKINAFLGLIFGVGEGIIILLIVIAIIKILPFTTDNIPKIFTEDYVNATHLFKHFYYTNIGELMSIVNK